MHFSYLGLGWARLIEHRWLLAMHYDMRPDRIGWTLFDVTTGRLVVWDDVPLTGVDLDAAHELLGLLHRQHRLSQEEACPPRITDEGSGSVLVDAPDPPVRPSSLSFRRA